MVVARGEIHWASLGEPAGSEPGFRRPVLVIQDNSFNRSNIGTAVVLAISSNLALQAAPGNVRLGRKMSGLKKDSVINVSQIVTVDKSRLGNCVKILPPTIMTLVDNGIRTVLGL